MATREIISSETLKWIDIINPDPHEMEILSNTYKLNPLTVRDCLQPEHLPKYEFDDEGEVHFLIIRYYDENVNSQVSSIQELTDKIAIFFTANTVITIHRKNQSFIEQLVNKTTRFKSGSSLVSRILWLALETFDEPANNLSKQLDAFENEIMLKKSAGDVSQSLFYLKRQASLSNKVLMLMLEPINNIKVQPGDESLIQDVKDQHLKMQTYYGQILDEVNNLLSISMSFAAQRTNDVMRVLTVFSVFFMPLTFIVGVYGMNFEFMPELGKRWGYPAVWIVMALVTLVIFMWFKHKKWL